MTRDNDVIWFMLGAKGPGAHVWAFPCRSNDSRQCASLAFWIGHHQTDEFATIHELGQKESIFGDDE